jgi:hypothetical protein
MLLGASRPTTFAETNPEEHQFMVMAGRALVDTAVSASPYGALEEVQTLADPNADYWQKGIAGASLVGRVFTGPLAKGAIRFGAKAAGIEATAAAKVAGKVAAEAAAGEKVAARGSNAVQAYEVGSYEALKARSVVGDGLDLHHVGQARMMEQTVAGYTRASGPAIALPRGEHALIPTLKGTASMTPRQLLARDIWNLRQLTNTPNSSLRELIRLNKAMYPGAFTR